MRILLWLIVSLFALSAHADDRLSIDNPHSFPLLRSGGAGAIYLTIHNHSDTPLTLISASTPVAQRVELHTHTMEGGVMQMGRIDSVTIDPASAQAFEAGGLHLMVFGITQSLKAGEHFPLTLTFDDGTAHEVDVQVINRKQ